MEQIEDLIQANVFEILDNCSKYSDHIPENLNTVSLFEKLPYKVIIIKIVIFLKEKIIKCEMNYYYFYYVNTTIIFNIFTFFI